MGPAFHFENLKNSIPVFQHYTQVLIEQIDKRMTESKNGPLIIDIVPELVSLTVDIIGKSAFGTEFNALTKREQPGIKAILKVLNSQSTSGINLFVN